MIDMRSLFSQHDYQSVVQKFKESSCDWSVFQDIHKRISNNRCPICEVELNTKPNTPYSSTIDHFRPKAQGMYEGLKCEPRNYILMCGLCNERYKKSKFPLFDESKRAFNAKNIGDVQDEEPLLINPIEEDPLDFFELSFRQTDRGGILELKRNPQKIEKDKNDYAYQRTQEMIKLFGLGNCHKDIHPKEEVMIEDTAISVQECRIDILTKHYTTFIELAKAVNDKNKKAFALIMSNKNRKKEFEQYGFYQFIMKKQFRIL